jgi:3-hydroxyisobutyrate dehydrogenase-like beta-hydroxyacid dehydrogenase
MRVGLIGLGNVAEGMAHNLAIKGFAPVVRDIRPEPVAQIVSQGAVAAASNFELGQKADVVCVVLLDEKQVLGALGASGDDAGLLAGMAPGGVIVIHSTVPRETLLEVARLAAQKQLDVIDAPLTGGGGPVAARAGELTFMVGGEPEVLARVEPVLHAMACEIVHLGPLGTGIAVKAINNYLAVANSLVTREAIRIGRAVGVEPKQLLAMVNAGGVGSNWATLNWQRIRGQELSHTTGPIGLAQSATKDMVIAATIVEQLGVRAPALRLLKEHVLGELVETGITDNGV